MPLTREDVEHIAELAKLTLDEAEKRLYQEQLSAILDYAGQLSQVDTSAVPPIASVLPLRNVLRADAPGNSLPGEDVLANAPNVQLACFTVQVALETE